MPSKPSRSSSSKRSSAPHVKAPWAPTPWMAKLTIFWPATTDRAWVGLGLASAVMVGYALGQWKGQYICRHIYKDPPLRRRQREPHGRGSNHGTSADLRTWLCKCVCGELAYAKTGNPNVSGHAT